MSSLARFSSSSVKGLSFIPAISPSAALVASTVEALLVITFTRNLRMVVVEAKPAADRVGETELGAHLLEEPAWKPPPRMSFMTASDATSGFRRSVPSAMICTFDWFTSSLFTNRRPAWVRERSRDAAAGD